MEEPIEYRCDLGELLELHMDRLEDWAKGDLYEIHLKSTVRSFLGDDFDFAQLEAHLSELASWAMQADNDTDARGELPTSPNVVEQLLSLADGVGKGLISIEGVKSAFNVILQVSSSACVHMSFA